jgi:hypothetical protein
MDLLLDFGIEFKGNFKEDDEESIPTEGKKSKKVRAKKIMTCPHCNKEYEV